MRAAAAGEASDETVRALARWSGWGAASKALDHRHSQYDDSRVELIGLLGEDLAAQARRSAVNAHYTDPATATAMWDALSDLGFAGGAVLEPGCGLGVFMASAPVGFAQGLKFVGIERDGATARVAQALHSMAGTHPVEIVHCDIQDYRADRDFHAVIGNVPFGNVGIEDDEYRDEDGQRMSIHNYMIVKSLGLARPGALAAVITSRLTLDATNPAARRRIARSARLVGALRLPNNSFERQSGTTVTTDILILQKRLQNLDVEQGWPRWTTTVTEAPMELHGEHISAYYADNPDNVLGDIEIGGRFRTLEVVAREGPAEMNTRLRQRLASIAETARIESPARPPATRAARETAETAEPAPATVPTTPAGAKRGSIFEARGKFWFAAQHAGQPATEHERVPKSRRQEMRRLLGIRDALNDLVAAEADDADNIEDLRENLQGRYHRYVRSYGPIQRGSIDKAGKFRANTLAGFRRDPDAAAVLALERFDRGEQQVVALADIMHKRVLIPHPPSVVTEDMRVAVINCLQMHGKITKDTLNGHCTPPVSDEDLAERLEGIAFQDPTDETLWHPRSHYLSGDLGAKKDAAAAALEAGKERYRANIEALEASMPEPIQPADIILRLGNRIVTSSEVLEFLDWLDPAIRDIWRQRALQAQRIGMQAPLESVVCHEVLGWQVNLDRDANRHIKEHGRRACEHATERRDFAKILKAALCQETITVQNTIIVPGPHGDQEKTVTDVYATDEARKCVERLNSAFDEWWRDSPEMTAKIAQRYNERFNRYAPAAGDADWVAPVGLAADFKLRPPQRQAISRIIQDGDCLLGHVVGAGKTAIMACAAMEMRRYGLIRKPMFVVPNHLVGQTAGEIRRLFPAANVLVKEEGGGRDARELFLAETAQGDWDAVVVPESQFTRMSMAPDIELAMRLELLADLERSLEAMTRTDSNGRQVPSYTIKEIQKQMMRQEARIKSLRRLATEHSDDTYTFDRTGVDFLMVDEAHDYKNLATMLAGVDRSDFGRPSQRATDLYFKLKWMRETYNPRRVVTLATGTPISNKLCELYTMQTFVQPYVLEAAGVASYQAWVSQFGHKEARSEISAVGHYHTKVRFARYINVPELLAMWFANADIKLKSDVQLDVPEVRAGRPGRAIERSDTMGRVMQSLSTRAETLKTTDPDNKDNMLAIISDGKHASVDWRLLQPDKLAALGLGRGDPARSEDPYETGKLAIVADTVADFYHQNKHNTYKIAGTDQQHPRRGALQLVFLDVGVPKPAGFSAYTTLRELLADRGVPPEEIEFARDVAKNDKPELYRRCREGQCSVLVGATAVMGTGMNVQDRCVALHHVDATWKPSDMEQREGRIIRQGNQNRTVSIERYAIKKTTEAFVWQAVQHKARLIDSVMRGDYSGREIDEISQEETEMIAEAMKTITVDDPLRLELLAAEQQANYLKDKRQGFYRERDIQRGRLSGLRSELAACSEAEPQLADATRKLDPWRTRRDEHGTGHLDVRALAVSVAGHGEMDKDSDADKILKDLIAGVPVGDSRELGTIGPFRITAAHKEMFIWNLEIGPDIPIAALVIDSETLSSDSSQIVSRCRGMVQRLDDTLQRNRERSDYCTRTIATLEEAVEKPFPERDELRAVEDEVQRIQHEINVKASEDKKQSYLAHDEPGPTADANSAGMEPPAL